MVIMLFNKICIMFFNLLIIIAINLIGIFVIINIFNAWVGFNESLDKIKDKTIKITSRVILFILMLTIEISIIGGIINTWIWFFINT